MTEAWKVQVQYVLVDLPLQSLGGLRITTQPV